MIKHILPFLFLLAPAFGAQDCPSLAKLELEGTTIARAEAVPAGGAVEGVKTWPGLRAFCRVAGSIKPSSDSNIQFELWMPQPGWNGRFFGAGNGGFAGSISYAQMQAALARGFAVASTDTGHHAGVADASWALGHPEKVVDFGYRAIHLMTLDAKTILHAFYGDAPAHSYFSSCSNGGRQALMEAQRFPEDYDGIIAGAPGNYWTHLLANSAWGLQATLGSPDSYISSKKLPAIQAAALAACDAADGLKDGIIEDPSRCHFDPSVLACLGPETDSCLTAPQLTALKKLYAGAHFAGGKQVFPGYEPGGEAELGGWQLWITGPAPARSAWFGFGAQFFKNMMFEDPAWDFHSFDINRDTKAVDAKLARILNATDPDLSRFRARGGKLILYHGWNDAASVPRSTIDYYNSVVAKAGSAEARGFVGLFMVPGMQHCYGGSAPNSFGQFGAGSGDAERDMFDAIERWVEQGIAPERIIATKRKNDLDPRSEPLGTRPLCAYPSVARYKGTGSTDDAANYACVAP